MQSDTDLKFRLQFIALSQRSDKFPGWNCTALSEANLYIYTHPGLEINTASNKSKSVHLVLIGFIIDPNFPGKTNKELIEEIIADSNSISSLSYKIGDLAGRFVFIINISDETYVMHDMCGLRTVYYSLSENKTVIATNPAIMKEVMEVVPSADHEVFIQSKHYKTYLEYWLPCGLTLYDNVDQLMPNHYLDIRSKKQVRFWPNKKISEQGFEESVKQTTDTFQKLILAAKNRFKLSLPLTAGWDSRILLSAARPYLDDIYVYTLQYRWLVDSSPDIKIPRYITKRFDIPFHKIDCRTEMNPDFNKIYKSNIDLAHDDWASITNGMIGKYPKERVVLRGNVSEVARNSFYSEDKDNDIKTADQLLLDWPEWSEMPFVMNYLDNWIKSVREICKESNIEVLDLWYMELFMGGWLAIGQNEWDIIHEEFTPYNYRPWVELMLGVPKKYRMHEKPILYKEVLDELWPELTYWPINPPSWNRRHQFKYFVADNLKKIGLYNAGLKIYRKAHPVYLKLKGYNAKKK